MILLLNPHITFLSDFQGHLFHVTTLSTKSAFSQPQAIMFTQTHYPSPDNYSLSMNATLCSFPLHWLILWAAWKYLSFFLWYINIINQCESNSDSGKFTCNRAYSTTNSWPALFLGEISFQNQLPHTSIVLRSCMSIVEFCFLLSNKILCIQFLFWECHLGFWQSVSL